ncbi:SDR family NAD(P)-dependent oxidoreductase [Conexibacter arvalis]|uniref:NAD(P)-dependent dehydrogenase (Short-subunit alcohol dehydrogenase family) n=1 Tax=Conexibacter arvalis TaxID=912552 RepID=A0A840I6F1_9ACTN|nr:SDR family oxidoreductase [Conexibacter arvalis]MBB4660506.1 NAD(P)-dependent dehydrogenase (short-subunit alcohol dehydrogenase family) [Conexibacter arvalis]
MTLTTDGGAIDPALAVVTGAASGVGRAAAEALVARGTAVVAVDLGAASAGLDGAGVDWVRGDVAEDATWEAVAAACARCDPRGPGALVACAGTIVVRPFLETGLDDFRRLFEVNVLGVVRGMQALLPGMVARGGGAVAVVCSVDSFIVEQEMSAYATSKAALLHAVRSAALEHARDGVRINAVCPGAIETPLLQRHFDQLEDPAAARAAMARRTPVGRILEPREVAEALCFLVGPGASGLSGAAITVDGGLTTAAEYDHPPRAA